jgi:hypothetical protein
VCQGSERKKKGLEGQVMAVRAGSFFFCGDERSEPGLDALSARRIIVGESWKTTPDEDSGSQGSRAASAMPDGLLPWGGPLGGSHQEGDRLMRRAGPGSP